MRDERRESPLEVATRNAHEAYARGHLTAEQRDEMIERAKVTVARLAAKRGWKWQPSVQEGS